MRCCLKQILPRMNFRQPPQNGVDNCGQSVDLSIRIYMDARISIRCDMRPVRPCIYMRPVRPGIVVFEVYTCAQCDLALLSLR